MMDEIHEKYQRYTNIKHCVAVSCKTNRYIEKLKDLIIALGSADEKMKETYPVGHLLYFIIYMLCSIIYFICYILYVTFYV